MLNSSRQQEEVLVILHSLIEKVQHFQLHLPARYNLEYNFAVYFLKINFC